MSAYKTFAVWGAGNVGLKIVRELLKEPNVAVIVLCRPVSFMS
jgi:Trk K+ transport system NAD-binding subunit